MTFPHIEQKLSILNSLRPLSDEQVQNLKSYIDVKYTYNSNAIEGSTLDFSETKLILQEGLTIGGKSLNEHLEAINHKEAIDFIEELSQNKTITLKDIKDIHGIILKSIDKKNAGRYKDIEVGVRKSDGAIHKFCPPHEVEQKMQEFISWLKEDNSHPIIKASLAHLKFVTIHPFSDGNGRMARLLLNLILLQNSYPITVIKVSDRVEYIKAIEIYQNSSDEETFINFIAKNIEQSLDEILEILQNNIKII